MERSTTADEATAVTEYETEEENSIVTSNTAFSSANAYVLDYRRTLYLGNSTPQRFEPVKSGTWDTLPFCVCGAILGKQVG